MGEIVTFYSYKGGVGRSMALANVAVLLSQWNYRVLIVDWDLEAPGLEFYFKGYLDLQGVADTEGMIELLCWAFEHSDTESNKMWQNSLIPIQLPSNTIPIHLLTAGRKDDDYFSKVRGLDVTSFYSEHNGGLFIENLREEWKQQYDFILIDSRAGITDIGGICTVQFPDILLLLSTATEQSLRGTLEVAQKVNKGRQSLPVDRYTLLSLPILSRFDASEEFEISKKWLERFAKEFAPIYDYWLPAYIERLKFVEVTKIPYIAYFSFGEKLPVIEQGTDSPQGLGYIYQSLSALIARKLVDADQLLINRSNFIRTASHQVVDISESKEIIENEVKPKQIKQILLDFSSEDRDIATAFIEKNRYNRDVKLVYGSTAQDNSLQYLEYLLCYSDEIIIFYDKAPLSWLQARLNFYRKTQVKYPSNRATMVIASQKSEIIPSLPKNVCWKDLLSMLRDSERTEI